VYQIYGLTQSLHISEGTTNIIAFNPTSLAQRTNADMSGAALMFSGFYFKA
jgi:hypothetical protein